MPRALLVEDDDAVLYATGMTLERQGIKVTEASSVKSGLEELSTSSFDIVISDIRLTDGSGLEILEYIESKGLDVPVIITTGYASLESAVFALRHGASDYLQKPVEPAELVETVWNVINNRAVSVNSGRYDREWFFAGTSAAMQQVYSQADKAAGMNLGILITGESGTGKEVLARRIFKASDRKEKPFVVVNCGALDDNLFSAELFGYKKGSFTGAHKDHQGYFEKADGGTIFLDEIGEISPESQAKLLRAIESREFNPVGDPRPRKVNVRLIAATNRNLEEDVEKGRFRLDLFYRLNVFGIHIPPLRERRTDIPGLVEFFIKTHSPGMGRKVESIDPTAMEKLMDILWPGNVRQLEHAVVKAIAMCEGATLKPEHFDILNRKKEKAPGGEYVSPRGGDYSIEDFEKKRLCRILADMKGDTDKAAKALGVDRSTIYRKVKRMEIDLDDFRPEPHP